MIAQSLLRPEVLLAALLVLLPFFYAALLPRQAAAVARRLPASTQIVLPALLCLPYALVAHAFHNFQWGWLALYALLPVAIAFLLNRAGNALDADLGNWRDFLVLLVLGLAVDLRWFEPAWPAHLSAFGKILLLDAGVYGFVAIRRLGGVGLDLRLKVGDGIYGLREFVLYALIAIPLGFSLRFLHFHREWPQPFHALGAFIFTFLFIAIPEEIFFRGWLQNLVERRLGRRPALLATAILFGLAHWNKRTVTFNWRYVLMASIAGIFYGRAWRAQRRVGASAITHATVDAVWSLWLR